MKNTWTEEIDRLREVNAELVAACRAVLATWDRHNVPIDAYLCRDRAAIEAAIEAAERGAK